MTLLALPKPGPPWFCLAAAAAAWSEKKPPRLRPSTDEPPTRRRSRRVRPSQVSLPGRPGITSMDQHLSVGTLESGGTSGQRGIGQGRSVLTVAQSTPLYRGVKGLV